MAMRYTLLSGLLLLVSGSAWADTCTLIADADTGRILKRDGACEGRSTPASTFKIALSLMGYDSGILQDAASPAWPYRTEYGTWNDAWKKTTAPRAWLNDSVVWYSQVLTRAIGPERFRRYVEGFDYGNRDVSGNPGKADGLTHSWLSSSLRISPDEQIGFLRKLLKRELPVSAQAQDWTIAIMPSFSSGEGWIVHGKTGSGFETDQDGRIDRDRQVGWFIGWAEKNWRTVLFARRIRDERKTAHPASFRARDGFLSDLPMLLPD